jgi:hypothetical protein
MRVNTRVAIAIDIDVFSFKNILSAGKLFSKLRSSFLIINFLILL